MRIHRGAYALMKAILQPCVSPRDLHNWTVSNYHNREMVFLSLRQLVLRKLSLLLHLLCSKRIMSPRLVIRDIPRCDVNVMFSNCKWMWAKTGKVCHFTQGPYMILEINRRDPHQMMFHTYFIGYIFDYCSRV